ncbi:MAG: GNAT family N-acetyltransferase [Alphaproteobacteria bacterium]
MNAPAVRVDEPLDDFIARHRAALAENEARHIVMLGLLDIAEADRTKTLRTWSLGEGGACAVLGPGRLLLGDLDEPQCAALAEAMTNETYRALVGPDETAKWFVARAEALGRRFRYVMPQRIMALTGPPRTPDAPGAARSVTAEDIERLADWLDAFVAEAVPNDPPIPDERKAAIAASGDAFFWEVEGRPVSTAAIVRETGQTAGISLVYTPPAERGRGYAGAVTAAAVEAAYARGKRAASLFTDLRNPVSNRCYEKFGFTPVCDCHAYKPVAD